MTDKTPTIGMLTATTKGGYPYLDYDTENLLAVEHDIARLQEKFRLGKAALMKTEHGYHAIFFWNNRMSWKQILEIIDYSIIVDPKFKEFKHDTGFSRIRILGDDIKMFKIIKSPHQEASDMGDFLFMNYKRIIQDNFMVNKNGRR